MQRRALSNTDLVALVATHALALVADKAAFIGMLVFVFDESGEAATAAASIASIIPLMLMGPIVGWLLERHRPDDVRTGAMLVQMTSLAASALAASAGWGVVAVVSFATVSVAATTIHSPSVAMMSPIVVRDAAELTVANIWVGYAASGATVLAPVLTTVLLVAGGASGVLAGSAATVFLGATVSLIRRRAIQGRVSASAASAQIVHDTATAASASSAIEDVETAGLRSIAAQMRRQPGSTAVLVLGGLHYALLMIFGILSVVLARESLDLGAAGPGNLNLLYGLGGLVAAAVGIVALRQRRLAPAILGTLAIGALAFVLLAVWTTLAVAVIAVPMIGICRVMLDALTRVMLLRVTHPHQLGGAFAMLQMATGVGGVLGAFGVQYFVGLGGVEAALLAVGVLLTVVAVGTWPALHRADQTAEVPTVEMALLRRVPTFVALPAAELEALARTATPASFDRGVEVIRRGEPGDDFHVVVEGRCRVDVAGRCVRELGRGDGFGEVALLTRTPRTATITALEDLHTLVIDRATFLAAVTGSSRAHDTAWLVMSGLEFDDEANPLGPSAGTVKPGDDLGVSDL